MKSISEQPVVPTQKKFLIQFLRSPVSITRISDSKLSVEFAINQLDDPFADNSQVRSTTERQTLETGLVIKSIGYTTVPLDPSIPIDDRRGCIQNEGGKIRGLGPGLYCSGWAATGPSGVLLGTMNFSFEVAKNILRDVEAGDIVVDDRRGADVVRQMLTERKVQFVTFDDWSRIDEAEKEKGQKEGKPREKIVSVDEMVTTAKSGSKKPHDS
jgi:adrenodoxin-NADP+ reductase